MRPRRRRIRQRQALRRTAKAQSLWSEFTACEVSGHQRGSGPEFSKADWPAPGYRRACWPRRPNCTPGDAENLRLWREFLPPCLDDIERIYRRLNVTFDDTLGESFYHDRLSVSSTI